MRIRSFIGAALLGLAMMAFAPVAMADPAPDICALDLSPPVTVQHAVETADITCSVLAVEVATAVPIAPNGEDEPAAVCTLTLPASIDIADFRLHDVDPGRCLA